MKLTQFDVGSDLWQKLTVFYSAKLAKYRIRLENPNIDEKERVKLCWLIQEIKELLALGDPKKERLTDATEE